jgi:phosphate transport system ATP-binding protein
MSHQPASDSPFLSTKHLTVHYEDSPVLGDVSMDFNRREVTALIGPAGSGKTSLLIAMNRLLELNPAGRCEGRVILNGEDVLNTDYPAEELRRRLSYIGSEPVCFSRSIWDNVAWGARVNGFSGDQDELVESSLRRAGLWHEVKGMLRKSACVYPAGSVSDSAWPVPWRYPRMRFSWMNPPADWILLPPEELRTF